jgi:hypothetical protein
MEVDVENADDAMDAEDAADIVESLREPFPTFGEPVKITLLVDIHAPSRQFVKGKEQVAFTEQRRDEIKRATRDKWRPSSLAGFKKLVSHYSVSLDLSCSHS